jgi:hypothetical protein
MLAETPTWSQASEQSVETFDAAACSSDELTLDCGRCVEVYRSAQAARTDLRILVSRPCG